ncbi:putative reverse transcriptase domain-containing protein [Tanacetum coccineum]|uniref:Reverse transcriptase domain-containing protein n=1 Tax=Tanacetum coccineum TaxID=301880 RepID=A0ABQ4ZMD6_9ASTR
MQKSSTYVVVSAKDWIIANEGMNTEQYSKSSMDHGKHTDGKLSELKSFPSMVEGSFPSLSDSFGSPNHISLAAKIHDISALSNDSSVKATDGAKLTENGVVSYVNLLNGEPSKKTINFAYLSSPDCYKNGMDAMLENGSWLIRNVPLILKKWSPNANLPKEDLSNVLFWVKFHDVPRTAFIEDGSSYARVMNDLRADVELKDTLVVAILKIESDGQESEKKVDDLVEHEQTSNPVEIVNKDKGVTVKLGSMRSTSMDLQDGNSKSDVVEEL